MESHTPGGVSDTRHSLQTVSGVLVKDMHTLEEHRQEVVERDQEGVGPLAGEVRGEGGVLVGGGDERQDEPVAPLGLALQLHGLLLEELLRLLQVSFLEGEEEEEGLSVVQQQYRPFLFSTLHLPEWC